MSLVEELCGSHFEKFQISEIILYTSKALLKKISSLLSTTKPPRNAFDEI